jgi:hypothetical protein
LFDYLPGGAWSDSLPIFFGWPSPPAGPAEPLAAAGLLVVDEPLHPDRTAKESPSTKQASEQRIIESNSLR